MRKDLALGGVETRENKVSGILASWWAADANANPVELVAVDGQDDVPQAIVAAMTAVTFESDNIKVKVEFVMKNDEVGRFNAIELEQVSNRPTREVHKSVGFRDDKLGPTGANPPFGHQRIGFVGLKGRVDVAG